MLIASLLVTFELFADDQSVDHESQSNWVIPSTGIPFFIDKNRVFAVVQNSKGTSFKAFIDTGSPFTLIDQSMLAHFEHYETGEVQETGGINSFATSIATSLKFSTYRIVMLRNVYIAGSRVGDLKACVLDYHTDNYDQGDLLLGMNVFQNDVITIEFSTSRITVGDPNYQTNYWTDFLAKDFTIPIVAASDWGRSFPLVIDTGCQLAMRGFLKADENPKRAYAGNLVGIFSKIQTPGFGLVTNLQGFIHPNPWEVSLVGVEYLQKVDWYIDFINKRVAPVIAEKVAP